MTKQVSKLKKKSGTFYLIGKAKVGDYTFQIDNSSTKSDWIYNSLGLYVYCGERHGNVKCELMGGYGSERKENFIYAHGKKDDGRDDFDTRINVDWSDRLDKEILRDIGEMCFTTVGLEKGKDGKTVYEKFLSPYDAIAYAKEHLTNDTIVNIKGSLEVNEYEGNITYKRKIESIVLSNKEEKDFKAVYKMSILIDNDSIGEIDNDTQMATINARVVEYFKSYKNNIVGKTIAIPMELNFDISKYKKEDINKVLNTLFKPLKKNEIDEVTLEGEFISTGSVIEVTEDDIPDDIRTLMDLGVYSREEAIAKCTETNKAYTIMVLTKPSIKMEESKDGTKTPVIIRTSDIYSEDELELLFVDETDSKTTDPTDVEDDVTNIQNDELDWMKGLGL